MVCGRSKNVGMPTAMLLHADGIGETNAGNDHPGDLAPSNDSPVKSLYPLESERYINREWRDVGWLGIMVNGWRNKSIHNHLLIV